MKREDGKSSLHTLLTLVIAILIGGVIIAMVFVDSGNSTNTQNSLNTQNSTNIQNDTNVQNS